MENKKRCLARLTNWNKTAERLAPCMTASRVVVCKNIPKGDSPLCEDCLTRPVDGKYQSRILHGLLTEPIPAVSRLYGSPWYWLQVDKHGEPTNKEWLAAAQASQLAAEEFCSEGAWKVQRPGVKEVEMAKSKALAAKAKAKSSGQVVKSNGVKDAVSVKPGTLLSIFCPVEKKYDEDIAEPVMVETDTYTIRKKKFGDVEVWIAQNGFVFDCNTGGKAGELIGKYVNEEFQDL
jgi:hypothetical protein